MSAISDFIGYEPRDCKEVYSVINTRQITALMFHSEMADMFGFLGLEGFKCMHEYQFLSESAGHRSTKSRFICHHDKILSDDEVKAIDIVPDEWMRYTRMDVTPSLRRQHVEKAMNQYLRWETDTKEIYCHCAAYLLEWHKIDDFNRVKHMVKEVSKELAKLKKLCLRLRASDYSLDYIASIQDELCCKYKCKPVIVKD